MSQVDKTDLNTNADLHEQVAQGYADLGVGVYDVLRNEGIDPRVTGEVFYINVRSSAPSIYPEAKVADFDYALGKIKAEVVNSQQNTGFGWLPEYKTIARNYFWRSVNKFMQDERIVHVNEEQISTTSSNNKKHLYDWLKGLNRLEQAAYREAFLYVMRNGLADPTNSMAQPYWGQRFAEYNASNLGTITYGNHKDHLGYWSAYPFSSYSSHYSDGRKMGRGSRVDFLRKVTEVARFLYGGEYDPKVEGSPIQIMHHLLMSLSSTYVPTEWQAYAETPA